MAYHKCASIYGTANSAASVQTASGAIANFNTQLALPFISGIFELPYRKNGYTKINVNKSSGSTVVRDKVPYLFRTSGGSIDIGESEEDTLVGGTVVFNQLVQNGNFATNTDWNAYHCQLSVSNNEATVNVTDSWAVLTSTNDVSLIKDHKYLVILYAKSDTNNIDISFGYSGISGNYKYLTTSYSMYYRTFIPSDSYVKRFNLTMSTAVSSCVVNIKNIICIDLTQMFGSTIADYIYSLEQGTAGAGVAWFRNLFPKDYYAYNTGELMSVKTSKHITTGFNQWDEETEVGSLNTTTGAKQPASDRLCTKNYQPCVPNVQMFTNVIFNNRLTFCFYDRDKNFISSFAKWNNDSFTTPENAYFYMFYIYPDYGKTYKNDICINLHWDGERDGEYEPYVKYEYPLDSNLELRGIPKLDANNKLYYDGDTYESDGTVTRKYGVYTITGNETFSATGAGQHVISNPNLTNMGAKPTATIYDIGNIICDFAENKAYNTLNVISDTDGIGIGTQFVIVGSKQYDNWSNLVGKKIYFELATPTTEEAQPFTNPQKVNDFGTEKYEDNRTVPIPVGHDTFYSDGITIATKSFGQTIYGGEFNSVTGELTSSYNADGTQKQTPDIIQLSPLEIISFIGNNNIWSDANGNSSIKYKKIMT